MYNIGDKVVYPMHGAGVIDSIEEREILGEKKKYYTMRMPVGDMKVMIPVVSAVESGLRNVINEAEVDNVLSFIAAYNEEENSNWNKRYRENYDRMRTGNIFKVAAVVKALMCREKEKGLSTGEHKMLSDARYILISELVLAKNSSKEEISALLDEKIFADSIDNKDE